MHPRPRLALIGLFALAVALACNLPAYTRAVGTPVRVSATPAAQATALGPTTDQHAQIFETAWEAVRDQYIRADYDGVDWNAVGEKYRAQLSASMTDDELAQLVQLKRLLLKALRDPRIKQELGLDGAL